MKVSEMHQSAPLKMDGMLLDVKHLRNTHRPRLLGDDTVMQRDALFLEVRIYSPSGAAGPQIVMWLFLLNSYGYIVGFENIFAVYVDIVEHKYIPIVCSKLKL